jgi:hypothetical protein
MVEREQMMNDDRRLKVHGLARSLTVLKLLEQRL